MNRNGLYVDIGCDEWRHRYICKIVKQPECHNTQTTLTPYETDDVKDDEFYDYDHPTGK